MSIATAYAALGSALADALVSVGALSDAALFAIDPPVDLEPDGEADSLAVAAGLINLGTGGQQRMLGGAQRRYQVDRQCALELALSSPDLVERATVLEQALAACAALPETDPTLGGLAERFEVLEREDEPWPPNGVRVVLTFLLRVRSGDALGLSA